MGKFSAKRQTPGQRYAAEVVERTLTDLGLNTNEKIHEHTGIAMGTLSTFFNGKTWPHKKTRQALEEAMGHHSYTGHIQHMAENYGNAVQWVSDPDYRKRVADMVMHAIISRKYDYRDAGELAEVPESDVQAIVRADPDVDYSLVTRLTTAFDLELTQSNSVQDKRRDLA